MRRFAWLTPASVPEAASLAKEGATVPKAGGIDLLDQMKEGLVRPTRLVALEPVLEREVSELPDGSLRIGAGITLAEIARDPKVRELAPALAHAAGEAATPQVREMATLGGNLLQRPRCWYFRSRHYHCLKKGGRVCFAQEGRHEYHALFDNRRSAAVNPSNTAPALVSLDASLEVLGEEGVDTIRLDRFYEPASESPTREHRLKQGEIVTAVVIPPQLLGPLGAHYEVRHKQSYDWPLAIAAVNLNGERPVVVLGAVASIPWTVPGMRNLYRSQRSLEEALPAPRGTGQPPLDEDLERLADLAVRDAEPLPGNAWRVPVLRAAVQRAFLTAAGIPESQW